MRQLVACSILAALLVVAVSSQQCDAHRLGPAAQDPLDETPWFSCNGECTAVLSNAVGLARKSILVKCYRQGPAPVLRALERAEASGVDVRTIVERGRARYTGVTGPQTSHAVRDPNYAVDRPEVLVIDNRQVIKIFFASDSDHGRKIASLFVIRDRDLAHAYTDDLGIIRR